MKKNGTAYNIRRAERTARQNAEGKTRLYQTHKGSIPYQSRNNTPTVFLAGLISSSCLFLTHSLSHRLIMSDGARLLVVFDRFPIVYDDVVPSPE